MKQTIRIGIDTGGTFTDFTFHASGRTQNLKVLSTPEDPTLSILEGIRKITNIKDISSVIHGTTVATNALLEKKGGHIALITTKGFEDALVIGRQTRRHLYRLDGEEKTSLLPRKNCFGVEERTYAGGNIGKRVSLLEVKELIKKLEGMKVDAVAVCLIHSYSQADNEKFIQNHLEKAGFMVSSSWEILPEYREYERTAVTAVNAYLMPVMSQYLERLEWELKGVDLRIMQSNEGYILPKTSRLQPVRTALSGPAGGVVAAYHLGRTAGYRKIVSFDMGGTSSDVSLIDNAIAKTQEAVIGDFPLRLPIIDIHTVGAGGGSLAFMDQGGSLRVGPKSAGADPGPACYGKSMDPTVTDANLVLGRLIPEFFLGGDMRIFPERSIRSVRSLSKQIQKSLMDTAHGIITIANANMEKAIRVISVERGHDPRDFFLFSFGGAGGLHAVDIARQLSMKGVIVPPQPGVLSAQGLLFADSIKDLVKSILKPETEVEDGVLRILYSQLETRALSEMKKQGLIEKNVSFIRSIDIRYFGQSYEFTLPFKTMASAVRAFHTEHKKTYSYAHQDRTVEIVNIRVKAVGKGQKIRLKRHEIGSTSPEKAFFKHQSMFFKNRKYKTPVFDRSLLNAGNLIRGPALIADKGSTTLLPPSYRLRIDPFLNLLIERQR
jgi:N-methylhydantoinase A/oxoprolinase/acetone carboxylase beta subunit